MNSMTWRVVVAILVSGLLLLLGWGLLNRAPNWNEIMVVFAVPLLLAIFGRKRGAGSVPSSRDGQGSKSADDVNDGG